MEKVNQVILSLGSNIEDRLSFLKSAVSKIEKTIGNISVKSSVYESEALGFESDTPFYNICIEVETLLDPFDLLKKTQLIEIEVGRKIKTINGYESRKIDIDIVFFGNLSIESSILQIPHKLYKQRLFVLLPLCEIYEIKKDETSRILIQKKIESCVDKSVVKKNSLSL